MQAPIFAARFDPAPKVLSMRRGRLAREAGLDKSGTSRRIAGRAPPPDPSLEKRTHALARRVPGGLASGWKQAGGVAPFGEGAAPPPPPDPRALLCDAPGPAGVERADDAAREALRDAGGMAAKAPPLARAPVARAARPRAFAKGDGRGIAPACGRDD